MAELKFSYSQLFLLLAIVLLLTGQSSLYCLLSALQLSSLSVTPLNFVSIHARRVIFVNETSHFEGTSGDR